MDATRQIGIDVDAPILPGEGLGGLHLRIPIAQLQRVLEEQLVAAGGRLDWLSMANLAEAKYRLGPIEIAVDVRNGKVFKLTALSGYRGLLFGQLAVGMPVAHALELDPRLSYDEAEEVLLVRGCNGVTLDVPAIDPNPQAVPAMRIQAISVVAPEAFTVEGMAGRW